jgi:phosphatidylserine decarboxylase
MKTKKQKSQLVPTESNTIILALLVLGILILLFFVNFYRKPRMLIRDNYDTIYSPAYGKIMKIEKRSDNTLFLAIFLSPFDIHYQTYPINCIVEKITWDRTGQFNLAYDLDRSSNNEKVIHTLQTAFGNLILSQIAGFLTRRIDYYATPQQKIQSGELLGLIHFGSRVDIILPRANIFQCMVSEGERVEGQDTMIGRYRE